MSIYSNFLDDLFYRPRSCSMTFSSPSEVLIFHKSHCSLGRHHRYGLCRNHYPDRFAHRCNLHRDLWGSVRSQVRSAVGTEVAEVFHQPFVAVEGVVAATSLASREVLAGIETASVAAALDTQMEGEVEAAGFAAGTQMEEERKVIVEIVADARSGVVVAAAAM